MSDVRIDPAVLGTLAGYLADIEQRTRRRIEETRAAATATHARIADEVARRRREVELLEAELEACLGTEDAECSEVRRQLRQAERALETGNRALAKAAGALHAYRAQSQATLQRLEQFAIAGKRTIARLQRHLDDYSAFGALVPGPVLNAPYAGRPSPHVSDAAPAAGAHTLAATNQTSQLAMTDLGPAIVFDHPAQAAQNAVFNQGSAHSDYQGTCGVCAAATLLRIAGVRADEGSLTTFASGNGLCTANDDDAGKNGGTSAPQLVTLLRRYGDVCATDQAGASLSELAGAVEQGRGVIVGVNARLLNEGWYGPYSPETSSAHWIVLSSVARDPATNALLGFYIFDSNGSSSASTCQLIPAAHLQIAYDGWGSRSVTTTGILW